jgi:Tol biopolymer transport system component/DNA-binding winged helix-turn-helix (wHTH) protein
MRQLVKHFFEFGDFQIDVNNQLLLRAGEVVALNPKTFDLLLALIFKQGDVATKDELLKTVWKDTVVEEANLSHHVHMLRRALEEDTNGHRYIETIPKRGYRFVAAVREVENGHGAGNNSAAPSAAGQGEGLTTVSSEVQSHKQDSEALTAEGKHSLEDIPVENQGDPHPLQPSVVSSSVGLNDERLSSKASEVGNLDLKIGPTGTLPKPEYLLSKWAVSWRMGAVFLVMIALLLGIVSFLIRPRQEQNVDTRNQPRGVPFTTLPGMENQPAFSPDGNQVAFCWNGEKEDNLDVYVKLVGTHSMLRLTTHPSQDTSPAWSPDGRFIAFHRNTGEESGFYLVPALGGMERKVAAAFPARAHFRGHSLDWTPDGKFLVVVDRESEATPFNISVVSIETGKKRRLFCPSEPSTGVMALAVSPDGQSVAFSQIIWHQAERGINQSELYTVSILGGEPKRLTFDRSFVSGMGWSPDGRQIVFASQRGESSGLIAPLSLWRMSVYGGQPERLSVASQYGCYPSNPMISRDGSRLVCEQRDIWSSDIWRAPGPHASGDAILPAKFIASTWPESNAQFSPNGKRIAYKGGGSGNHEIWVCDEQGQACAQLTSMAPKFAQNPRWSPDGSEITFDTGDGNIYVVRSDGGSPRALTTAGSHAVLPSWSRDGQWVYYASNREGEWQIWKSPAAGGQAVQVTQHGGFEAFESLDGGFLYYTKPIGLIWAFGLSSIWRIPVAGGEETLVVERTSVGYWGLLNDGLCYLDPSGDLPFSIQYLNFATGHNTRIGSIDKEPIWNYSNFAVSPDGRWILYTKRPREERDLMLVENFR